MAMTVNNGHVVGGGTAKGWVLSCKCCHMQSLIQCTCHIHNDIYVTTLKKKSCQ